MKPVGWGGYPWRWHWAIVRRLPIFWILVGEIVVVAIREATR